MIHIWFVYGTYLTADGRAGANRAGREAVASYAPEPPFKYARCFCRHCGTGLGEIASDAETFPIAAHCLDDDPQVRNRFHEWVSVKPAWYEICDEARRFPENPG